MGDFDNKLSELYSLLTGVLSDGGIEQVFCAGRELAVPSDGYFSDHDRLAIPFSGCHRMVVPEADELKQITPGRHQATFMPQGSWNRPDWRVPVTVATFAFDSEFIRISFVKCPGKGINERFVTRSEVGCLNPDGRMVLTLLNSVMKNNPSDRRGALLVETLLHYCVESLLRGPEKRMGKAYNTWKRICSYLDECYAADLSREAVAQVFGISPNYLSNLFKREAGMSFNEYLNRLRIKRSCYLLKNFKQTLDEIAFNCGYHDTSYFCRVFKKMTSLTPGQFREEETE